MPRQPTLHWNPPESVPTWRDYVGKTRCGRKLRDVLHTEDIKDVSCDRCLQLIKADGAVML